VFWGALKPLIGQATNSLGVLPGLGEGRQQHGREQGNSGKNHQKLD